MYCRFEDTLYNDREQVFQDNAVNYLAFSSEVIVQVFVNNFGGKSTYVKANGRSWRRPEVSGSCHRVEFEEAIALKLENILQNHIP